MYKRQGLGYEAIISNVFRSASADVCSKYYAKDMHSGMRAEIENAIKIKMEETLSDQGIFEAGITLTAPSFVYLPFLAPIIRIAANNAHPPVLLSLIHI